MLCSLFPIPYSLLYVFHAAAQSLENVGWDEAGDVAAEAEDVFDHAGADEGVSAGGLQEDGFDFRR